MASSSFESIYTEHATSLKRVAFLIVGSEAVAEDIVHDIFVRCADRIESLEHPPSYLRVAVVNECRKRHRRRLRFIGEPSALVCEASLPNEQYEMMDALTHLSSKARAAIVLRYYVGMSHAEIAQTLKCRPGTARSLVSRGLQQLREELNNG